MEAQGNPWQVSTLSRVAACGRRRISKADAIRVRQAEGVAHYTGVQLCGSIHSCPVCAARVRAERAAEIERGLRTHLSRAGGVEFLTLTVPHHVGDRLKPLLKAVAKSFRRVLGGRGWTADRTRYGVAGTIRVLDTTHGPNSWHPHLHVLILTGRPLSDQEREALLANCFARWAASVVAAGYEAPLPGLCQMQPVRRAKDIAAYVGKVEATDLLLVKADKLRKVGNEMARSDLKQGRTSGSRSSRHRTPFEVLADFAITGDCDDLEVWHEWEQGSRGAQAITWSKGLKQALGVAERTDVEITQEQVGGTDVLTIRPEEWHALTATRGATLKVLELVEQQGPISAMVFIEACYRAWAQAQRQPF